MSSVIYPAISSFLVAFFRIKDSQRLGSDVDLLDLLSRPNHIIPIYPHHTLNSNHHQAKAIIKFKYLGQELQQLSEERAVFFDP